jgi:hypothetical protein
MEPLITPTAAKNFAGDFARLKAFAEAALRAFAAEATPSDGLT